MSTSRRRVSGRQQRDVARQQHQRPDRPASTRFRLLQGVRRAELRLLDGELERSGVRQVLPDVIGLVTDDHRDRGRRQGVGRLEDVLDQAVGRRAGAEPWAGWTSSACPARPPGSTTCVSALIRTRSSVHELIQSSTTAISNIGLTPISWLAQWLHRLHAPRVQAAWPLQKQLRAATARHSWSLRPNSSAMPRSSGRAPTPVRFGHWTNNNRKLALRSVLQLVSEAQRRFRAGTPDAA